MRCTKSIDDPKKFWSKICQQFYWKSPIPEDPSEFMRYNFDLRKGPIKIEWMVGAKTNICYNALDRMLKRVTGTRLHFTGWAMIHQTRDL